jgi:hypothetical protein
VLLGEALCAGGVRREGDGSAKSPFKAAAAGEKRGRRVRSARRGVIGGERRAESPWRQAARCSGSAGHRRQHGTAQQGKTEQGRSSARQGNELEADR